MRISTTDLEPWPTSWICHVLMLEGIEIGGRVKGQAARTSQNYGGLSQKVASTQDRFCFEFYQEGGRFIRKTFELVLRTDEPGHAGIARILHPQ